MTKVHRSDLLEIIGKDETVAQNQYSADVALTIVPANGYTSGEILQVQLLTREDDAGAGGVILTPAGKLLFFSASPGLTASNTSLATAAIWETLIGMISVEAADWHTDAKGGGACLNLQPIGFPAGLTSIYIAFFLESATGFNSAAGDDEKLSAYVVYRTDNQ